MTETPMESLRPNIAISSPLAPGVTAEHPTLGFVQVIDRIKVTGSYWLVSVGHLKYEIVNGADLRNPQRWVRPRRDNNESTID